MFFYLNHFNAFGRAFSQIFSNINNSENREKVADQRIFQSGANKCTSCDSEKLGIGRGKKSALSLHDKF